MDPAGRESAQLTLNNRPEGGLLVRLALRGLARRRPPRGFPSA